MLIVGLILAALAAGVHAYIFVLESFRWEQPATRELFKIASADEARTTKQMAFNQGFYNLLLAVETVVGIVLVASGLRAAGGALVIAGVGSMLAAAALLFATSTPHRRAAIQQGALPLLALIAVIIGLL